MTTLIDTVVAFQTAFTGLLIAAVTLDQVTSTTRRRRSVEFWQNQIQASSDEADTLAYTILKREALGKLVSSAWIHLRLISVVRAYFWLSGAVTAAWLGYALSTPERDGILFTGVVPIMEIAGTVVIILAMAESYSALFVFRIQRARVRMQFLQGEEPASISSPHGPSHTLQLLTGSTHIFFGTLFLSIATFAGLFTIAFVAFTDPGTSRIWIPLASAAITVIMGASSAELLYKHLPQLNPDIADYYPPHGDGNRSAEVSRRIEQDIEELANKNKYRKIPGKRKGNF